MTEADFDHCPACGALPALGIRCHPRFAMRVLTKADPYMLSIYTHSLDELVATYRAMGGPPTEFEKWDGMRWDALPTLILMSAGKP